MGINEEVKTLRKQNGEYKKALVLFKDKLNEVAVFNANLAYSTRLFTEHSTTRNEKLNILDFSLDLNSRYTFWSGITGGLFLALSYFGTDQSQVQRYLSGKSLKESQMGLIMNGFLKVPFQFFILLLGVIVFVFYQYETPPIHFNSKNIIEIKKSNFSNDYFQVEKEYELTQDKKHELLLNPMFFENDQLKKDYLKQLKNKKQKEKVNNLILKNNKDA